MAKHSAEIRVAKIQVNRFIGSFPRLEYLIGLLALLFNGRSAFPNGYNPIKMSSEHTPARFHIQRVCNFWITGNPPSGRHAEAWD
jgi:hypothetical protein